MAIASLYYINFDKNFDPAWTIIPNPMGPWGVQRLILFYFKTLENISEIYAISGAINLRSLIIFGGPLKLTSQLSLCALWFEYIL